MIKKEIIYHLLTFTAYAFFVTFLGRHFFISFTLFWIGGAVGILLLPFDPIVSAFLSSGQSPLFQSIKENLRAAKHREVISMALNSHSTFEQPILHSALFQFALMVLSLYVVTSSRNFFALGLVIGMVLHLIRDELELRRNMEFLKKRLFWNIHREISDREQKIYLWLVFLVFGLETLFLI